MNKIMTCPSCLFPIRSTCRHSGGLLCELNQRFHPSRIALVRRMIDPSSVVLAMVCLDIRFTSLDIIGSRLVWQDI